MELHLKEGQTIYTCSMCGGVYKSQGLGARIGCLVMHGPNSCCHLGEEFIENPKWRIERVPLEGGKHEGR